VDQLLLRSAQRRRRPMVNPAPMSDACLSCKCRLTSVGGPRDPLESARPGRPPGTARVRPNRRAPQSRERPVEIMRPELVHLTVARRRLPLGSGPVLGRWLSSGAAPFAGDSQTFTIQTPSSPMSATRTTCPRSPVGGRLQAASALREPAHSSYRACVRVGT
jgi:hypothetical protein